MPHDSSTIDRLVLLLVSGLSEAAVRHAASERFGLDGSAADEALAEARRRITIAADYSRDEEIGRGLLRLEDLYGRALKVQDIKTALAAQKERSRLLDLYHGPTHDDGDHDMSETVADHQAAREHLAPLELAPADAPLAEHARLAVARILELEAARGP